MSIIYPFRAYRPAAGLEEFVSSVPYDVVTREEAAKIVRDNPLSFLRVLRPEIDLPEGADEHSEEAYRTSRKALAQLVRDGRLVLETEPRLFLYRLEEKGHAQTGIVACCDAEEYLSGVIKRHELTRPDKEHDRVRHVETLGCHTGPVLLTFAGTDRIRREMQGAASETPLWDFTAADGVRHTAYHVSRSAAVVEALAEVPSLYIADGHHRAAAAARVAESVDSPEASRFLCVLFPHDELRILAYNRYVGLEPAEVSKAVVEIERRFSPVEDIDGVPSRRGEVCFTHDGRWRKIALPKAQDALPRATADTDSSSAGRRDGAGPQDGSAPGARGGVPGDTDPVADLDLSVFGRAILEPILGITDQRSDPRIDFVGGRDAVSQLSERVRRDGGIAFSFYPVSVSELMAVSDAGMLMPPKSTWFSPKLRSGLFLHPFRSEV